MTFWERFFRTLALACFIWAGLELNARGHRSYAAICFATAAGLALDVSR